MQIRKTYKEVNPELLYAEVRDFVLKQGTGLDEQKMETYALPNDTSSFITRGTLIFSTQGRECVYAHVVGSVKTETRVMLDINEELFPAEKVRALEEDLDFVFGSYEVK